MDEQIPEAESLGLSLNQEQASAVFMVLAFGLKMCNVMIQDEKDPVMKDVFKLIKHNSLWFKEELRQIIKELDQKPNSNIFKPPSWENKSE